jgi:hypothetical protein
MSAFLILIVYVSLKMINLMALKMVEGKIRHDAFRGYRSNRHGQEFF